MDLSTWTRCFTLYIAVISKVKAEMVPAMVAHLHTVFKLHNKAPQSSAWLEYDIQFMMEAAASAEKVWKSGDPWQHVSCLPDHSSLANAFDGLAGQPGKQQGPIPTPPVIPVSQSGKVTGGVSRLPDLLG